MSAIVLRGFTGEVPKLHKRVLPQNAAQLSMNASFRDGTLSPIPKPKQIATVPAGTLTIFNDGATWHSWPVDVDVARAPVASDRLYFTGSGAPKIRVSGVDYALALPAPAVAPTVSNASTVTEATASAEAVYWAYTWVTQFGEESPPSPLSAMSWTVATVNQTISAFSSTPAARGITHRRLYRSQTSATGATELMFAAEIPVDTTSYSFNIVSTPLGEAIPSKDFDPPPATMLGITAMPNGMMAAFDGKELLFCEPYIPHAWPGKYALTVDSDIVGLVSFGSNLAVLTKGAPYVVQGLHPSSMSMERLESGAPCLSARGIVDLGYAAIYPSVDGLMMINGSQTENITASLFAREQWQAMSPETMMAARFDGAYAFSRRVTEYDLFDGGNADGWSGAEDVTFDPGGAVLTNSSSSLPPVDAVLTIGGAAVTDAQGRVYVVREDAPPSEPNSPQSYIVLDLGDAYSAFGDTRFAIIDTATNPPSFTDTDIAHPDGLFFDPSTADLFIVDAAGAISEWMASGSEVGTSLWKSKLFSSGSPLAFGAAFVRTSRPIADGDSFAVRVYGDGFLMREITSANEIQRLPSSRMPLEFEIEIESSVPVVAVAIAHTPSQVLEALQ